MDTGFQLVGRRPRTSEEVHLPVQWRHSNPEPVAAASALLVDCPWTASALPGSIYTGQATNELKIFLVNQIDARSQSIPFIHSSTFYNSEHLYWRYWAVFLYQDSGNIFAVKKKKKTAVLTYNLALFFSKRENTGFSNINAWTFLLQVNVVITQTARVANIKYAVSFITCWCRATLPAAIGCQHHSSASGTNSSASIIRCKLLVLILVWKQAVLSVRKDCQIVQRIL